MDLGDLVKYNRFGFRKEFVEDPDDCTSIYDARRDLMIHTDYLPLSLQIKTKRTHDSLTQEQLGRILRLPASTISMIETGQRLIPKNRLRELEKYLYEDWYVDGRRIYSFSEDEAEPVSLDEEMDVEAQRTYWKKVLDETGMHGSIT
jgi:transcriptional regulator with XRE-family HTH domain